MRRLAVIPSDPIEAYLNKGYDKEWLKDYYNPCNFFDKVYLLSPLEENNPNLLGMEVIRTQPRELKKRLKQLNINMVRAYGGHWSCDMACNNKVSRVPVIVSIHDTNPELLHNSIKNADIVFCMSNIVRELVLKKFNKPDRVWILPNRVNFNIMYPYPAEKLADLNNKYPFKYKILHVGRKTEEKNLDTLIKALKILGNEYCMLAVGKGDTEKYIKLAGEEKVIEQCFFIESIENKELARYYSWADCMCTPSRWEGFGIVFIEALACESVVVTSDIAPMNEYIKHMENGILVKEYENPKALADIIKIACCDEKIRNIVKKNARKSVEKFEKSRIDKLEVSYYEKILKMKQRGEFRISFYKRIFSR